MIEYSAGIVTAYGSAVRAGYTGTYEDFCRQQAQYAENAQAVEQAKQDAQTARNQAQTAKDDAVTAKNTAVSAKDDAVSAKNTAVSAKDDAVLAKNTATTKAQEAGQSATSAGLSATSASQSAQNAEQSAQGVSGSLAQIQTNKEDIDTLKADLVDLQEGGYIADAQQIQTKINAWLADHPEATTTVQNGSLTETKFSNALKLKTIKDYVTPEMFGAVGDGITDDTEAIQMAIDTGKPIYVPNGTYVVSSPLKWFDVCNLEMSSSAIIKAKEGSDLPYLIGIRNDGSSYSLLQDHIVGGTFDANGCCSIVIGINYTNGAISDCKILNPKRYGIYVRHNEQTPDRGNGSVRISSVRIINTANLQNVGVYSGGTDDIFTGVVVKDFETGFNVGSGSKLNSCHVWLSDSSLFADSVAYVIRNTGTLISGCISDTMRYGIKTIADYVRLSVVNFSYYINTSVIDASIATLYPLTVFDLYSDKTLLSVTNFDGAFSDYASKILSDNSVSSQWIKFVNLNLQNTRLLTNIPYDISAHKIPNSLKVVEVSGNITEDTLNSMDKNTITAGYCSLTSISVGGWGLVITTGFNNNLMQVMIIREKGVYTRMKLESEEWGSILKVQ